MSFAIIISCITGTSTQSLLPIGQWKSHLSYKEGMRITQSRDKIIYASGKGIFTIDKEDLSVTFLSKEDGLTDVNVNRLYYDSANKQLIIVYLDNSIDVLIENNVINIPFIKTNTSILGSKNVNDFLFPINVKLFMRQTLAYWVLILKNLNFPLLLSQILKFWLWLNLQEYYMQVQKKDYTVYL